MRTDTPHELNTVKLGERVCISRETIEYYATYLPWLFAENVVIGKGTFNIFKKKYLPEVAFWSDAYVSKSVLFGTVTCFGSYEDHSPRLNVGVEFKAGRRKFFYFFSENNFVSTYCMKAIKVRHKNWYWGNYVIVEQAFPMDPDFEVYIEDRHGWHKSEEYMKGQLKPYPKETVKVRRYKTFEDCKRS
jgi:hypothetical protein